jgi:hypothetical protein
LKTQSMAMMAKPPEPAPIVVTTAVRLTTAEVA